MKRHSDNPAGDTNVAQRPRTNWNSEVLAASSVPSMDVAMSSHVRHLCDTMPNNCTGLWGHWGKMAVAGTKVANAIGLNTFPGGDAVTLFKILRGYMEADPMDTQQQERVAFGIENEARARTLYSLVMNKVEVTTHDRTMSFLYPWINYGCDGHAKGHSSPWARAGPLRSYLVEIKCPTGKPYADIPLGYMVQIQTGMAVHGMPWCDFVMYTKRAPDGAPDATPVDRIKVWRVQFNPDCWQRILDRLVYFMNCLHTDTPPETEFMLSPGLDKHYFESPHITTTVIIDQEVLFPDDDAPPA